MRILLLILITTSVALAEQADEDTKLPTSPMGKIAQNEVLVEVSGVVCSFCAFGMQKKLSKLPFVDQSKYKKGIKVEIEKQLVTMALKPGQQIDLELLKETVIAGGYEPIRLWALDENQQVSKIELGETTKGGSDE